MKFLILIFSIFISVSQAQEFGSSASSPYANHKEGKSQYINEHNQDEIQNIIHSSKFIEFNALLTDAKINSCASDLRLSIEEINQDEYKFKNIILALREKNLLDDVAVFLILQEADKKIVINLPQKSEDINSDEKNVALKYFRNAERKLNDGQCKEDIYRNLYYQLAADKNKFQRQFKKLIEMAYEENVINNNTYKILSNLRKYKIEKWPTTLKHYFENREKMAEYFPTNPIEYSNLITDKKFQHQYSLHQELHFRFNTEQIALMADVIKNLKNRFESNNITININYSNKETEVITLSPMERFRLSIKLLRKELAILNNSDLLNGQHASYLDIIAAGYETGIVKADELEALQSLEEIWNPKKSQKEKAIFWLKNFGGMATVLVPQPYSLLAVLAIMVIDQQINIPKPNPDEDYNLL